MSGVLSSAIVERLAGMDLLQRSLSTYQGRPAIFTARSIPEGAQYPYVWSPDVHAAVDDDVKNARLWTAFRDVWVCCQDDGSDALVDQLAWCVRSALHKVPLRLEVDENVVLNAAPPIVAPTSDGVLGRIVQLRLLISEG